MTNHRKGKFISQIISDYSIVMAFLTFAFAILCAGRYISDGMFETSIYEAYPAIFWLLILLSLFLGYLRSIVDILFIQEGYRWIWGVILIIMINGFLISLPYFRDYAFNGQYDVPYHYGSILDIQNQGFPNANNFYPILHILVTVFANISGLELNVAIQLFPVIFYLIGIVNSSLLAYVIDNRPEVQGMIVLIASLPVYFFFQAMFYPFQVAVYMLPFFLGLLWISRFKNRDWRISILFIFLLLFLPFLHPLGVVSSLLLMVALFVSSILFSNKRNNESIQERISHSYKFVVTPISILLIAWFSWFSTFGIFGTALNQVLQAFINGLTGFNSFERYFNAAQRAGLSMMTIIRLITFTYGPGIIIIGWAGTMTLIVIILWIFRRVKPNQKVITISVFILLFVTTGTLTLFLDLIAENPFRYFNYALIVSPVVISLVFFDNILMNKLKSRFFTKILLLFLPFSIFIALAFSVFNIYYSPIIGEPNNQYSYAQRAGFNFLFNFADRKGGSIYSLIGDDRRLYGVKSVTSIQELQRESTRWYINESPAHFGYQGLPDKLGNDFKNPEYLILTAYERSVYTDVWPEGGRINPVDFIILNNDPRWNRVYDSEDFTLWARR